MPPALSTVVRDLRDPSGAPARNPSDRLGRSTDLGAVLLGFDALLPRLLGERCGSELTATPGLWVLGHVEQIEAVITDLVLEARDAMLPGRTLRLSAVGVHDRAGAGVLLTATDRHLGRERRPCPCERRSCLAVTRSIVLGLGGEIRCETGPGEGVLFQVRLPQAPADAVPGAERSRPPTGAACVLVVEPDEALRQILVRALTVRGHAVTAAGTFAAGLERARALGAELDLLLLDRSLPDGEGHRLGEALLLGCPRARTVLMARDPSGLEGLRVLPKPFDGRQLLDAVGAALAG